VASGRADRAGRGTKLVPGCLLGTGPVPPARVPLRVASSTTRIAAPGTPAGPVPPRGRARHRRGRRHVRSGGGRLDRPQHSFAAGRRGGEDSADHPLRRQRPSRRAALGHDARRFAGGPPRRDAAQSRKTVPGPRCTRHRDPHRHGLLGRGIDLVHVVGTRAGSQCASAVEQRSELRILVRAGLLGVRVLERVEHHDRLLRLRWILRRHRGLDLAAQQLRGRLFRFARSVGDVNGADRRLQCAQHGAVGRLERDQRGSATAVAPRNVATRAQPPAASASSSAIALPASASARILAPSSRALAANRGSPATCSTAARIALGRAQDRSRTPAPA